MTDLKWMLEQLQEILAVPNADVKESIVQLQIYIKDRIKFRAQSITEELLRDIGFEEMTLDGSGIFDLMLSPVTRLQYFAGSLVLRNYVFGRSEIATLYNFNTIGQVIDLIGTYRNKRYEDSNE